MTFVNELISEEDKAKYDWSKFKAWDFSWPLRPWKWTIDREKDVFFVGLEGQGRESERPEVEITGHLNGKFWDEIYWKILRMSIPVEIEMNRDEIILDLREAIDAYGRFHDRSDIKSVKINFLLGE
jgi:hypothetical protein